MTLARKVVRTEKSAKKTNLFSCNENLQKIRLAEFRSLSGGWWWRYGNVTYHFGYVPCMCLSGVSMKIVLLIVPEKFDFKKNFRPKYLAHKAKFLMFFSRPFLRN